MAVSDSQLIEVGRVSGLFGVQGWVKIFSYTRPPGNIINYSPWYLNCDGKQCRVVLQGGKAHGKGVIAQFESCSNRETASQWVDTSIAVYRHQFPEIGDEYYWTDLQGLKVTTTAGMELGIVDHLIETGANDVLVVVSIGTEPQRQHLIPFIRHEVVTHIDLDKGELRVHWDPDY